jgi:hypothetical protein
VSKNETGDDIMEDMYTVIFRSDKTDTNGNFYTARICMLTKGELLARFNGENGWLWNDLRVLRENYFSSDDPIEIPAGSILILRNGEVVMPKVTEVLVKRYEIL